MVISFHISLPVLFRVVLLAEHQANKHQQVQNDIKIQKVIHDDVIKWKHFRRCWPVVRGIHRSRENSPHKGQWRGASKFYLICAWVNIGEAGDLKCHRAHYDITVRKVYCDVRQSPTPTVMFKNRESRNSFEKLLRKKTTDKMWYFMNKFNSELPS